MSHLLFYLVAFLSEIIGTVGGFGSSLFFVPIAGFFFKFQTVLALTSILHVFSNTAKILLFRRKVNFPLFFLIGIPSITFVILGAYLSSIANFKYLDLTLGIFLVFFSIVLFILPRTSISPSNPKAMIGGGISGFFTGLIGTGGALRGLTLAAFNLEKSTFVATSAAIDFGVDCSRMGIYLQNNFLNSQYYLYIPGLIIIAFAGSFIGKLLLMRISQENFRKIVLVLIFFVGIMTLTHHFRM
ncbi:MAG: sulfite exporter TauE/SafE family protein [Chlorobiaceae bacterium]|jgi:uncharacterized protein|nr:sulfite exporter TauE/SafE family protein [Chlorobiaceae bacterium]